MRRRTFLAALAATGVAPGVAFANTASTPLSYDPQGRPTAAVTLNGQGPFQLVIDGMVGTVGGILGDASVNIAGMQVSRAAKGGSALVALSVDSPIPVETLAEIENAIDATAVRAVSLV